MKFAQGTLQHMACQCEHSLYNSCELGECLRPASQKIRYARFAPRVEVVGIGEHIGVDASGGSGLPHDRLESSLDPHLPRPEECQDRRAYTRDCRFAFL